jgi:uncharacterized membrane protein YhhN
VGTPGPALLLSALVLACACLCIRAERRGRRGGVYFFKPATMLCVIALAVHGAWPPDPYAAAILVGLVLSLAGDVWLMLPSDRFAAGLASFLLAHLCYLTAFAGPGGLRGGALGFAAFLGAACVALALVLPGVRGAGLRVAVVAYVSALAAMGWQAAERAHDLGEPGARLAAAGALLFLGSDTTLAWNRFRRPFREAEALVLATYFGGQWLIALSTGAGASLSAGEARAFARIAAVCAAP